jgi:hypothetical protein
VLVSQVSCVCVHSGNWRYKIGTDPQARDVSLRPVPTTIAELVALPHVDRPPSGRIAPVELTTYVLRDVILDSFQRPPDSDIHLVLRDAQGRTMIAEVAPPYCTANTSVWRDRIVAVRDTVEAEIGPSWIGWDGRRFVSLAGVGYFDSAHGQPGVAPNGIEIHPVLAICFGKGCVLPDLALAEARRSNADE